MGKIFCVMGKSASGKDTIYNRLLESEELSVKKVIPYTTRPIRDGETEGESYYFCNEDKVEEYKAAGKIIEIRMYPSVYGPWYYFTVDDGQIDLQKGNYLMIGTPAFFIQISDFFGKENVVPIYIEVEDGDRLLRAISREKKQKEPKYEEMCRRFLADAVDFSDENLKNAGIDRRFYNNDLETTISEIKDFIKVCQ